MNTQQAINATREYLNRCAKTINEASNDMQGSPYWNNCKRYIKIYFRQNDIKEISIPDFSKLTGFNFDNSKKMLIEINKELFTK